MRELLALGTDAGQYMWLIGLAMARIVPVFQIVPFLSGRHLTTMTRGTLAFAFGLFLVPWLHSQAPAEQMTFATATPLIAKEAALGVLFGFLSSLAFYVASGVGFLVDNQRGLSMTQSTDPLSGEETSPLGSLALQSLIMVFIASGGLALFFQAILTTYAFWSPFSFWPDWAATPLKGLLLHHFHWYLTMLVALAAPMLLVCFLVDFGMGMMNRFAPQLNVFFLSMPVKSALVLALMVVYWAGMLRQISGEVMRLPVLWDALRHVFSIH